MIVDASAVLTVLFGEEGAAEYDRAMVEAPHCRMSVANFLEAAMVLESRIGASGGRDLDAFIEETPIELAPVTADHAHAARRAWRRFGKGNHPAGLNFGDCFAYALAETTGEPLLFKGADFPLTDIEDAFDQG